MGNKRLHRTALLLYSFLTAAVIIGICSKSSPLYPMNDWVDVHCFLTMGKGLLNGLVPYADLYEQKGPVLYFIYAVVALFSQNTFLGVYLLETVSFGLFLYFSGLIIDLYAGRHLINYALLPILAVGIGICLSFSHGGSVEEMCLFMFAYGMLCILRALHQNRPLTFAEGLLNGTLASMVFWIKFTMLGFYVGLCLAVALLYIFVLRSWKGLWKIIGSFLLGFAAVSGIVLLYFVCNNALDDLFTAYFYNNLFLYPSESEKSRLEQILHCLRYGIYYNPSFSWLLGIGLAWFLFSLRQYWKDLICVLLCFMGLVSLTYWGGKNVLSGYGYYDLVLGTFAVFGLAGISASIRLIPLIRIPKNILTAMYTVVVLTSLFLCGCYAWSHGRNTYLMSYQRQDLPQYRFAEIINETESPTLLNYGFLDGGFYYAADVVPNCKYFCTFNVPAPDMWQVQGQYIEEGLVDYVITRRYALTSYGVNSSKYELVSTANLYFEGIDFTYYLYRLK